MKSGAVRWVDMRLDHKRLFRHVLAYSLWDGYRRPRKGMPGSVRTLRKGRVYTMTMSQEPKNMSESTREITKRVNDD